MVIIYTDGSKKEGAQSAGASIVIENEEEAYTISLDKKMFGFHSGNSTCGKGVGTY